MALTITSTAALPSGHSIPRLGFGVYRNDEPYPAVLAALKRGYRCPCTIHFVHIRHIDTAEWYANEAAVGKAVRDSGLSREDVFITTKIPSGSTDPASSIPKSLRELETDYVDLWLMHSAHGGKECRLNIYKTLIEAKAQGKARDIGVSNFNVKHLKEIREAGLELPAVNQIELHPFCRQDPIAKYCEKHGILLEAFCPIVRGDFSDPILQEIAKKVKKRPEHVLIRWSLQRGYIPLPKSATPERIASNADVYDFELSAEDIEALNNRPQDPISWNPIDEE